MATAIPGVHREKIWPGRASTGILRTLQVILPVCAFAVVLTWAYAFTMKQMAERWAYDPRYAHGYLVPLFALYLLYRRRGLLEHADGRGRIVGLGLIIVASCIRLLAAQIYNDWLDGISFILATGAIVAVALGRKGLQWATPSLAFLIFMVPLPYRLELSLGWPLQRMATMASVYLLQVIGVPAIGTGNVIQLSHSTIGVVEACSGLSMMILFLALSTAVAILIPRSTLDRSILILSALPIAVVVNILRITVTGFLHEHVDAKTANLVFHDLAGWLMMPTALAFMGLELWVLGNLFLPNDAGRTVPSHDRSRAFGFKVASGNSGAGKDQRDGNCPESKDTCSQV